MTTRAEYPKSVCMYEHTVILTFILITAAQTKTSTTVHIWVPLFRCVLRRFSFENCLSIVQIKKNILNNGR